MNLNRSRSHQGSPQGNGYGFQTQNFPDEARSRSVSQNNQGTNIAPQYSGTPHVPHQDYALPDESWAGTLDLSHQDHSKSVIANSFDIGDIQNLTSSVNEEPWSFARPANGPRLQTNPQQWTYNSSAPKAYTIAGAPASASAGFVRPIYHDRPSWASSVDSGFESTNQACTQGLTEDSIITPQHNHQAQVAAFRSEFAPAAPPSVTQSESHVQRRRRFKTQGSHCDRCRKFLKNPSDAQKHLLQHIKPFHCKEYGCTRTDGFATKNDLQRHRKSVHSVNPLCGKATGYICRACERCERPSTGSKPKWWPRLDNFKAHITRKHKDGWDLPALIAISECARPDDAISESGYASQAAPSHLMEDDMPHDEFPGPLGPGPSQAASHGDMALFHMDTSNLNPLAGVGEGQGTLADNTYGVGRDSNPRFYRPRSGHGAPGPHNNAPLQQQQLTSPVDSTMNVPFYRSASVSNVDASQHSQQHPVQSGGYEPSPKRQRAFSTSLGSQSGMTNGHVEQGDRKCPECGKIKKRDCDLRKHMKRHTRPYGCTFPNCAKRFGSRNDWKRHEHTQHTITDMWRCGLEVRSPNGTPKSCGHLASHENAFVMHLAHKHGIPANTSQSQDCCGRSRIGQENHHHFWCGFCESLIGQQPESPHDQSTAWDKRFKHIGDHFDKNNCSIVDWVDIEQNKKKILITDADKNTMQRLDSKLSAVDDDSDLGDHGIPQPSASAMAGFPTGSSDHKNGYMMHKRRMSVADIDAEGDSDDGKW